MINFKKKLASLRAPAKQSRARIISPLGYFAGARNDYSKRDILFLRQLEVLAIIGIYPQEKFTPQPLWIDVEMEVNVIRAAINDEISSTVDYSAVYKYLHEYISSTRFQLIETLANQLGENLMKKFSLNWLRLTIVKKPVDMPGLGGAGIIIEKSSHSSPY